MFAVVCVLVLLQKKFIGGIGIPVEDLNFESVTSGYVLKAEYFLPERADEFRQKLKPQTIHRRRRSGNETRFQDHEDIFENNKKLGNSMKIAGESNVNKKRNRRHHMEMDDNWTNNRQQKNAGIYRWLIYRAIEMVINNSALNGHVCLLRSICEHAATPFGYEGGLMAEILHIILTPSTSRDDSMHLANKDYLEAELLGLSGESCSAVYGECSKSPIDLISTIIDK